MTFIVSDLLNNRFEVAFSLDKCDQRCVTSDVDKAECSYYNY